MAGKWTFLSNHAQVLLCIAQQPDARLRDIGQTVGITERAVHRIVVELGQAGYLTRERVGRRNRYSIAADLPLPDPAAGHRRVGELLRLLTPARGPAAGDRRRSGQR